MTLWRWLQEPDFKEQYRAAKSEAFHQAIGRLQQVSSVAVDTLESVMKDTEAPHSSRVSAAKTVLDISGKAIEMDEMMERIEKLERLLESQSKGATR
ncbi:hypothetical protein LLE49_23670 [Alicyclobacillus tolerans]|uniref:hypothetical protein n=1 Tax=Alicyclobacillus tolerans TaxID=90970 RepID=UPI001F1E9C1B|nr:hypothetical protein [Alicyclobacillus tolerans]MCF8567723.1 hypothetical protein [Alicyclobacillus tolerans]